MYVTTIAATTPQHNGISVQNGISDQVRQCRVMSIADRKYYRYLTVSERDKQWGLYVTGAG